MVNMTDICELYGFDKADEGLHPMYAFVKAARNSIMDSGVKQSECFFVINNALIKSLGFESINDFMTCLRGFHTRAENVFWRNIIPVKRTSWYYTERGVEVPTTVGAGGDDDNKAVAKTLYVTRDPATNELKLDNQFLGKMIVTPGVDDVFSPETTLVRCGFYGSCTVPVLKWDQKLWAMMVLVLDFDVSLMGPKTSTIPVEWPGVLQMFQFDSADTGEVLAKYLTLRSDPRIGQVVIHGKYPGYLTLRVKSPRPLSQRELLGDDLHHEIDILKVADGGYKGFAMWLAPNPSACANLNPWRHWGGNDNEGTPFYKFINSCKTRVISSMAFNCGVKKDILVWLMFNAHLVETLGKDNCVILMTRTMTEELWYMLWNHDNNILNHDVMSMTNPSEFMAPKIYSSFPAVDALGARRTPDGKKVIVNPLTYSPEGGMCYAFTPDNLYEVINAWVAPDPSPWHNEATLMDVNEHPEKDGEKNDWSTIFRAHLKDATIPFHRAVRIIADPDAPFSTAVQALNKAVRERRLHNIVENHMLGYIKNGAIKSAMRMRKGEDFVDDEATEYPFEEGAMADNQRVVARVAADFDIDMELCK